MFIWLWLQLHLPNIAFDAIKFGNGLLLLALLMLPLERVFALRRGQPSVLQRAGLGRDVGYYFLTSLLPMRLLALPLAGVVWLLPQGLIDWSAWPFGARLTLSLVVAEIGFYWGHRAMHAQAWLWRLHRVHHSAEQMDWLVNTRAHPLDLVLTRACGLLPLYLLGLAQAHTPGQLDTMGLWVTLIGSIWGYVIHANLRWRLGPLAQVISSPAFHHEHHRRLGSNGRTHNYAALMPWVDRLFGTFRADPAGPTDFGLDEPIAPGIAAQLIDPFLPPLSRSPSSPQQKHLP